MQQSRSVLLSQRYSPADDYPAYESSSHHHHHHQQQAVLQTSARQPLGESTGNIQAHSLNINTSLALCQPSHMSLSSLSPPIHSIPTPPIVPTQALPSTYGTSFRSGRSLHRDVSLRESPMGYPRGSKNPIYAYKHFADYRNKVMQKELEKEAPIWPLWLEDAFLDALLLIPQMGRKKFSSKTVLYGRNMLITEYLWIYHWLLNPPQNGERIPDRKTRERTKHPAFRTRKQVSSHIQVLKGFFHTLGTFHFIFPSKKDGKEDDKKVIKDDDDTESFKNNRVLIAIADGRLPDERPNYEYFARLLNADNDVFLRPKQCRIFVSSSGVTLHEKHITMDDGTARKQITGQTLDGHRLSEKDYPHLKLNEGKDYKDLPTTNGRSSVLLHEYTKNLSQKESSSIKDISNRWEVRFPELREKLLMAMDDTHPSDERTSRCVVGPCDTFQFEVVLDLHSNSKFPTGSELNGMVELSISRPDLHGHQWRSMTSVVKPDELHINNSEPEFWDRANKVDVIVSHRTGCGGMRPHCDCAARGSRDTICVPFPAASWANTFIKLAPYVNAEREREERGVTNDDGPGNSKNKSKGGTPSPKELLDQVAMYQEIWSAPSDGSASARGDKKNDGWRRRAVILWTFAPVHEQADDKGKAVTVPAGTSWKFLTKFDPTSQYHQQHAYLSGPPNVSRDAVMSPNPGYSHHLTANMQENLGAAYDVNGNNTVPQQLSTTGSNQMHISLLDGFPNGLATPPPTAGLPTSSHGYGYGFDTGPHLHGTESLQHHASFMSDGTGPTGSSGVGSHTPITADSDPFLLSVSVGSSGNESYDDNVLTTGVHDNGLHSWASQTWGHSLLDHHSHADGSTGNVSVTWADANQTMPASAYDHGLMLSSIKDSGMPSRLSRDLPHPTLFTLPNKNIHDHQSSLLSPLHPTPPSVSTPTFHQHRPQNPHDLPADDGWPSSWNSPALAEAKVSAASSVTGMDAVTNPGWASSVPAHGDFALSFPALRSAGTGSTRKRGRSDSIDDTTLLPPSNLRKLSHSQTSSQQQHQIGAGTTPSGAPTPDMGDASFNFDTN